MALFRAFSRSHSQSPNRSPQHPLELRDSTWVHEIFSRSCKPLCVSSAQPTMHDYPGILVSNDTSLSCTAGLQSLLAVDHSVTQNQCSQEWKQRLHMPSSSSYNFEFENDADKLLQTLCNDEQLPAALDVLTHMHIPLSNDTYMCMLKACVKPKSLLHAMHVYTHAAKHRNQLTGLLGDYLVITLAKCGAIKDACKLAHTLMARTVFTWTAIISAYVDHGKGHEALEMYSCMLMDGVQPNHYTFVSLLKACGAILNLKQGRRLHSAICKKGLELDAFIQNTLISMYSKCDAIKETEAMFETLPKQEIMSWNVMLSTYVERCQGDKALLLYRQIHEEGMDPDKHTILFAVQACGILAEKQESAGSEEKFFKALSFEVSQALHADARKQGLMLDVPLGNSIITVYGKCGALVEAEGIFVSLSSRDTMSWTALLAAYVEQGQGAKALRLYRQMLEEWISPERHLLVFALQASSVIDKKEEFTASNGKSLLEQIREALHASARQKGFASDIFVVTTLVNLYGKSGEIEKARNAFHALSSHDKVSWTGMLSAYIEQGQGEKVLQLYVHIQREGVCPDQHILVIALQACCILAEKEDAVVLGQWNFKVRTLEIGEALHLDVRQRGYAANVFVCNALVIMYGKCGDVVQAEDVFNTMSVRDLVTWTAMLSVYVEQGLGEKALLLYRRLQAEDLFLDDRVLLCMLQACRETDNSEICNQIHFDIYSAGYDTNLFIAASSIHAYGNCVSMLDAQTVFNCLPQPDVASYTACVSGYAGEGDSILSVHIFERMLQANISPNGVTFTAIFSACSHAGLTDIALKHFDFMKRECRLSPDLRHYGSLLDLLGRAGNFNKVNDLLKRMPLLPDLHIWSSLLAACRVHGNVELGKHAFDKAVSLQPNEAAVYDLMINMYVDAGLEECPN